MTRLRWPGGVVCMLGVLAAAACGGASQEAAREFMALSRQVHEQFAARDYAKAAGLCRRMIAIAPNHPNPQYNLACALARLGRKDEALAALEASVAKGFLPADHVKQDEDLASLRTDARFAACLDKARANERKVGMFEAGSAIPGVRTHEGAPEGGLRYRLRMSPIATAEKPNRLIIWLHPAGGSANRIVEPLSRRFTKLGFALLVPTQKDWRAWSGADLEKLFEKTLPAVAATPGIDATRPILMGYSAGGQAALMAWHPKPEQFGGLVLDAAYPVRPKPGGFDVLPLPSGEGVKRTPLFVLVGGQDGGSRVWKQVEPKWREAGVPLTIHTIPGKGHTWLFGPKQLDALCKWLGRIAKGQVPGAPAPQDSPKAPAPSS